MKNFIDKNGNLLFEVDNFEDYIKANFVVTDLDFDYDNVVYVHKDIYEKYEDFQDMFSALSTYTDVKKHGIDSFIFIPFLQDYIIQIRFNPECDVLEEKYDDVIKYTYGSFSISVYN